MTQCRYKEPISSFALNVKPEEVYSVNILEDGQSALEKANADLGMLCDKYNIHVILIWNLC